MGARDHRGVVDLPGGPAHQARDHRLGWPRARLQATLVGVPR